MFKALCNTSPETTYVLQHRGDPQVSVDTKSILKELPRASQPQAILKFWPTNLLDYRVHYEPQSEKSGISELFVIPKKSHNTIFDCTSRPYLLHNFKNKTIFWVILWYCTFLFLQKNLSFPFNHIKSKMFQVWLSRTKKFSEQPVRNVSWQKLLDKKS